MNDDKILEDKSTGTKLVNLEEFNPDNFEDTVYIGGESDFYDYEKSIHYNPYDVNKMKAKRAKEKYKLYFYRKILGDEDYLDKVLELKGKTLLSWMYPEHDHGEVIMGFLRSHEQDENIYEYISEEVSSIDESELGIEGLENREKIVELLDEKHNN